MPAKRTPSNRESPDPADTHQPEPIDIDDASIDETATVEPDEDLSELANEDDVSAPKGTWRERDSNRRAHGPDDLKS